MLGTSHIRQMALCKGLSIASTGSKHFGAIIKFSRAEWDQRKSSNPMKVGEYSHKSNLYIYLHFLPMNIYIYFLTLP